MSGFPIGKGFQFDSSPTQNFGGVTQLVRVPTFRYYTGLA